jgi:hypothetical protein
VKEQIKGNLKVHYSSITYLHFSLSTFFIFILQATEGLSQVYEELRAIIGGDAAEPKA